CVAVPRRLPFPRSVDVCVRVPEHPFAAVHANRHGLLPPPARRVIRDVLLDDEARERRVSTPRVLRERLQSRRVRRLEPETDHDASALREKIANEVSRTVTRILFHDVLHLVSEAERCQGSRLVPLRRPLARISAARFVGSGGTRSLALSTGAAALLAG